MTIEIGLFLLILGIFPLKNLQNIDFTKSLCCGKHKDASNNKKALENESKRLKLTGYQRKLVVGIQTSCWV